jgi:hypothetical protein
MKKALVFLLGFAMTGSAFAAVSVFEQQITSVGSGATISVSTFSWTKVPASNLSNRAGVLVNNPSSNSAVMVGILSTNSTAPTEATTIRPLEFAPSTDFTLVPISQGVYLYLMSINTSAENVHVQDVGQ